MDALLCGTNVLRPASRHSAAARSVDEGREGGRAVLRARSTGAAEISVTSPVTLYEARANEVVPRLWQSGVMHRPVSDIDMFVQCAIEEESPYAPLDGFSVVVFHARFEDAAPRPAEREIALRAAEVVAAAVRRGQRVLVACSMGRNRSGLVVGLALRLLGHSGDEAVALVRAARGPMALSNEAFEQMVREARPSTSDGGLEVLQWP